MVSLLLQRPVRPSLLGTLQHRRQRATARIGNDLIFVPANVSDVIVRNGTPAAARRLHRGGRGPAANRGKIVPRNASRSPWTNSLDFRLARRRCPSAAAGARLELTADVLNLLNLFDSSKGVFDVHLEPEHRARSSTAGSTRPRASRSTTSPPWRARPSPSSPPTTFARAGRPSSARASGSSSGRASGSGHSRGGRRPDCGRLLPCWLKKETFGRVPTFVTSDAVEECVVPAAVREGPGILICPVGPRGLAPGVPTTCVEVTSE